MKKITSLLLVLCLTVSVFTFSAGARSDAALSAEAAAEAMTADMQAEPQIKNVIFLIPDGGGPTLMDLADMVKKAGGFDRTKYPDATVPTEGGLNILPYLAGFFTTRSSNNAVTDSAAGGTALSSGYKTKNGYVGVTPNKVPRASILEVAKLLGKAVGTCTNADWVHATPASYTAHSTSREDYINMYRQVESKEMDVVLGVGYGKVTEFHGATIDDAKERGYKIIKTPEDAASVQPGDKLWGNVSSTSVSTDIYNRADRASLAELTSAAITALSGDPDGFFLMVEASWVDSGGHNSDALQTTSEYLSFDECWRIAVEFAKGRNDTVVIGAPDHDTGGLQFPDEWTNEVELIRTGTNPTTFTWKANGGHSNMNCPTWFYLPEGIEMMEGLSPVVGDTESVRVNYIVDNTNFAPYIADLIGGDLDKASAELFVDVTSIGNYDDATEKFVFNNGDKYIFKNTDTYYMDGEAVDMHGKVAYHIADKFYVPAEMIDEEDWNHKNTGIPETMEGEGTSESPYLINSAEDLKAIIKGMKTLDYKDVYFKQVENLEFTDDADFVFDDTLTFAGIYDGNGKTITWNGTYSKAVSLFPKVSGTIANLGVTGKLTSTSTTKSASIANTVTSTGKIINCYSQLDFEGVTFNGIAVKNEGEIINTYYGGKATVTSGAPLSNGGSYTSSYYISDCGLTQVATDVFEIAPEDSEEVLISLLTSGAARVQKESDVTLLPWDTDGVLPKHVEAEPIVTGVRLYPKNATAYKGSTYQFEVNVDGRFEYSWGINWSMDPQSELSGTYIDKNGVIHIDENETITSFTVMAKSKANGAIATNSILNISDADISAYPVGSGTKEDPYLIRNEADFVAFTNACIGGEAYKDKYFRQICDLDLAGYPDYKGMGSNGKFYGTYDGAGHVINVKIDKASSTNSNYNLFPYTWGTIMNLGTTGMVKNGHSSGGICRSLRTADGDYGPGVIVNCWSSADVYGNYGGGIVPTSSGKVINCAVYGDVEYGYDGGSGGVISAGTNKSCYFIDPDYNTKSGSTRITDETAKTTLYATLNANRASAASEAGVSVDDLVYWVKVDGEYPSQAVVYPYEVVVEEIEIVPEGTEMFKGEGRQLGISPAEINYDDVIWSIESASSESTTVDKYGYVNVGFDEENAEIKVKATLKGDTSVSDVLTITVADELDHIAAYRKAGYEIIYIAGKLGTTISDNTAPDKKVVFALKSDIKFSDNYTLNHNGGTFVITSAGGAINLGTKSISLGADLDADITFDNIAVPKTTGERSINAVGNNLTLTETFTTSTEDNHPLYINASNDGGTNVSDGNTITVETPSKVTVRGSGHSGNLTNGDVTYVFGKNADSSVIVAGKTGKEGIQARLNGDVKVIVKDNAKLSKISVAESLSYLEGDLDIEIKDNANVTKIDLNKKISGNAYIDIKSGTVGTITVGSGMVTGKSVIKADTGNASVGDISGVTYAVKYDGNLGNVEYSEDFTSVLITPTADFNLVKLTNGGTVKEYSAKINEEFSAPLVGGTTTVEFLKTDADFYTITFVDGDTVETQTVDAGAIPVAPAWTKDGYTLVWDKEITAATSSKTYTAIWEPAHVAAYRAAGYEIVYVTGSLESVVANNTAPDKKVVFALLNDVKGSDADSISHNGGTIVFTSAGGAINLGTSSMVLGKDKDANIIFDNIAVNKTTGEKSINAVGNNLTLTETFTTTTSDSDVLYINACNDGGSAVSDGNTITIETPSKIAIRGSGYSGNLTEGDVTYVFGKNANVSYILVAGKAGKTGARAVQKGNVKVIVKDSATLGRIAIAENSSYLEGSLDIEIMDNATVNKINLDKKVTGNVLIDIKDGTVGPIKETSGMVTGKIVIKADTDKATVGDITGADYVVNYNGNLGEVAYSADFKSITLSPDSSVELVRITNGDTVKEYNANGEEVTLAGEFTVALESGTTTVEFIEGEEESYTITFTDGEQTETQTVAEGTVPTAPAWTKDGYTLIWDKEIVAATESTTYTAFWELNHIAAYRAQGYEIIYADTNNKTTFKGMVNENTAPGKKVVFALMQNMGNENSFDIEPMGGTVVFTSAGGAFRFNAPMKFMADHDATIIFDHMTVTEAADEKAIIAYGNNITFTDTFKNATGCTLIVYANCDSTLESNGNTVTIENDTKMWVFASGSTGNLTNGDVTYIFGKNATGTLYAAGKVTKTDGRQTYVNGDVKVIVKDKATLSKINVAQNQSYLKGNLDIEIRDNANVKAINLDKQVEGNAYIDIKGGTVGPITETAGMVTGKIVIKADTDKATVGDITGADYVVNYNGDLGAVAYSADFKSITLTPDSSVELVRITNGDTVKEYNANGEEVTLAGEFTVALESGTTTVEFLTDVTEVYTITFADGDTKETQTVAEGTVPTAPTWTKDGYTLIWDKEIVAATESTTYTAIWEPAHVAAYRAEGYEIIYVEDTDGATLKTLVKNNTAADKKVVFALTTNITLTGDLNLNHNGGTIVITSAGGNINIDTKSILLYSDKDANFIFDNIAIDKGTGKRGINGLGNNITFTETFTTASADSNVLYLNALADSASAESNGSTIIVETPSKIAIRASGYSGNKTNGDVNYIFGKNANASLIVAGRAGADNAQLELNGNSTVIVKDNATISKISITDQKSYLTGNLDIEIRDNATVNTIDINAEVGGNAYIDIKSGTVNTVTFKSGVVKGKAVIKANTDKATVGEISGASYAVKYNGNLGGVAYSEDYASIALTPNASVKYVRVTNDDTVKEYNASGEEVSLAGEFSVDLESGTTTVEFLTDGTEVYTITFADGDTKETQTVAAGTVPTAPSWTKEHYTLGWDKEIVAATESTTYTAVWTEDAKATVTYVNAKGDAPEAVTDYVGTAITVAEAPAEVENFTFGGWSDGETTYNAGETFVLAEGGKTLTAVWTESGPIEVTGTLTVSFKRDNDKTPTSFARLYIYSDSAKSELHYAITIENDETRASDVSVAITLLEGTYYAEVTKNGYLTARTQITVTRNSASIGKIELVPGDIKGSFDAECGDGIVDIDDFIRVLRGFDEGASQELKNAVDINEDGCVNVSDIGFVKTNFGKTA